MRWEGVQQMNQGFNDYERRVHEIVRLVALKWQAEFEKQAKEGAIWIDRSANARQSLHAFIEELANEVIRVNLSHGVEYGVYLETRWSGKYSIIWTVIERNLESIRQDLQDIFRGGTLSTGSNF
jgi:hypothetical protein